MLAIQRFKSVLYTLEGLTFISVLGLATYQYWRTLNRNHLDVNCGEYRHGFALAREETV